MGKHLFSSRIVPLGEMVLVRVEASAGTVLIPEMRDGKIVGETKRRLKENKGIVVAVGPGSYKEGHLVPMDPRVKAGATIVFAGKLAYQPEDIQEEMQEEGLYFIPEAAICCILLPEMGRAPLAALKA
jgi:co-chaperonin GroES (HSP10)